MSPRELDIDGTYFKFPDHWDVQVFDEWPQFKKMSGALAALGCDVVALDGDRLWLIEMKDYTYDGAEQPQELHQTVGKKAIGTMALLFALTKTRQDSAAKEFAIKCLSSTDIHLALHVEVKDGGRRDATIRSLLPPLLDKLKRSQKALGIHKAHVTSTLAPSTNTPWSARRNPATRALHVDR